MIDSTLTASELLIWGFAAHFVVDWLLQNDWMARHKGSRRQRADRHGDGMMTPPRLYTPPTRFWDRHPAAYVHAGLHLIPLLLIFPWWGALAIAGAHLLIDTRTPLVWWSKLIRQTQPRGRMLDVEDKYHPGGPGTLIQPVQVPLYDVGTEVRFWTDQSAHVAVLAVVALVVSAV